MSAIAELVEWAEREAARLAALADIDLSDSAAREVSGKAQELGRLAGQARAELAALTQGQS